MAELTTNTQCDYCRTDMRAALLKTVPGTDAFVKVNDSKTGRSKLACRPCANKVVHRLMDFDGRPIEGNQP